MNSPRKLLVSARLFPAIVFLLVAGLPAHAAAPVVSNVRAAQRSGTHLVGIYYNASDPDGSGPLAISVAVSADSGATWTVPAYTFTGAYGPGVMPGTDRHIVWNAGLDWGGRFTTQCRVRIIADDGGGPFAPGMAYIPGGGFPMGDTSGEGSSDELPVHPVYVSSFFMDKYEVTGDLFFTVFDWAVGHGYIFGSGRYRTNGHPVHSITWYDAVKWCNARSEKEGLTPCYYTDASQTTVYRTGNLNLTNA